MDETQVLLSIGKDIEALINDTINTIVARHKDTFAVNDNTYIIPAVWGAVKDGELDQTQKQIYEEVNALVENVLTTLKIPELSRPQKFAIRYLVNRILIYNISFMNEAARNRGTDQELPDSDIRIN